MLIIETAVGPFVEERLQAFRAETEKLATDRRSKDVRLALLTAVDPAKAILGLKICDPAMGSGHFLVSHATLPGGGSRALQEDRTLRLAPITPKVDNR